MAITNSDMKDYVFLEGMYKDRYYPRFLVDKLKDILVRLCEAIEREQPQDDEALLNLTHAATREINALADEFVDNESEIKTVAREAIAGDFRMIASAYDFVAVDVEDLIEPREW